MRHRRALLGLTCASLVGGCNLFIGDWEVGGGSGSSGSTSSGAGDDAVPLETEAIANGGIAVFRKGLFRIETDPESNWQWSRWFYLALADGAQRPLEPVPHTDGTPFRTTCLWTAYRARADDGNPDTMSCEQRPTDSNIETSDAPIVGDATPVALRIDGTASNAISTFEITTRVYASGRVWTYVVATHEEEIADAEMGFGQIQLASTDFEKPDVAVEGLYRMRGGGAGVLSVDVGKLDPDDAGGYPGAEWIPDNSGFAGTDAGSMYFIVRTVPADRDGPFIAPFHLGSDDELEGTRADRIADLRKPGLVAVGAVSDFAKDSGAVDPQTGAYDVDVDPGATTVSLTLDGTLKRFEPAFDLHGWSSPTWTIELDGEVVAKKGEPHANAVATKVDDVLSFQYLGTIAKDASEAARTFTITE